MDMNNSGKLKDLQEQRKKILEKIDNLNAIFLEEKDKVKLRVISTLPPRRWNTKYLFEKY